MNTDLIRRMTPEARELEKKQTELAVLETKLAQQELELVTLQAELRAFEWQYIQKVGSCYAELDEINAEIAEAQAKLYPEDRVARETADHARTQAQETAKTVGEVQESTQQNKFKSSESLKKIYREVAKRIHPDLTTNENERVHREQRMAEANRAYEEGDEAKLSAILQDWESSPDNVPGEGVGAELIRLIRKIAQVEHRLSAIKLEVAQLLELEIAKLKAQYEEAKRDGRDLFTEMVARIDGEIASARMRLERII